MRNRFSGKCYFCGQIVLAGEGHFQKAGGRGRWQVIHADCVHVQRKEKIRGYVMPTESKNKLNVQKEFKYEYL